MVTDADLLTGALVNIHQAREELKDFRLQSAEEHLVSAQRLVLLSGAKDIGPLESARDLPDSYNEIIE